MVRYHHNSRRTESDCSINFPVEWSRIFGDGLQAWFFTLGCTTKKVSSVRCHCSSRRIQSDSLITYLYISKYWYLARGQNRFYRTRFLWYCYPYRATVSPDCFFKWQTTLVLNFITLLSSQHDLYFTSKGGRNNSLRRFSCSVGLYFKQMFCLLISSNTKQSLYYMGWLDEDPSTIWVRWQNQYCRTLFLLSWARFRPDVLLVSMIVSEITMEYLYFISWVYEAPSMSCILPEKVAARCTNIVGHFPADILVVRIWE
jgi:hypothetical protein